MSPPPGRNQNVEGGGRAGGRATIAAAQTAGQRNRTIRFGGRLWTCFALPLFGFQPRMTHAAAACIGQSVADTVPGAMPEGTHRATGVARVSAVAEV